MQERSLYEQVAEHITDLIGLSLTDGRWYLPGGEVSAVCSTRGVIVRYACSGQDGVCLEVRSREDLAAMSSELAGFVAAAVIGAPEAPSGGGKV